MSVCVCVFVNLTIDYISYCTLILYREKESDVATATKVAATTTRFLLKLFFLPFIHRTRSHIHFAPFLFSLNLCVYIAFANQQPHAKQPSRIRNRNYNLQFRLGELIKFIHYIESNIFPLNGCAQLDFFFLLRFHYVSFFFFPPSQCLSLRRQHFMCCLIFINEIYHSS